MIRDLTISEVKRGTDMDDSKEMGKDVEAALDNNTVPAEFDGYDPPPTHPEEECFDLSQNVKLQSEGFEDKGLENTIDNEGSVEQSPVDEAADANINTDSNMDADANTKNHVDFNMRTNMKVDADISGGGKGNTIDIVAGNTRVLTSNSDADITVDANMEANADVDADVNMDAGANTSTNAKPDANSETDSDPNTDGDEKFDVDAITYGDANTNRNAKIVADFSSNVRHEISVSNESSVGPPSRVKSDVSHNETNAEENKRGDGVKNGFSGTELFPDNEIQDKASKPDVDAQHLKGLKQPFLWEPREDEGSESGSEEDQAAFMKELESFFKERSMEFKPPKFYGEGIDCLKLWRAVTRLGGYDQVTSCKLWRQVGESFKPPKTCTTVSWTFRIFYEKALLEYEKHKMHGGELPLPDASLEELRSVQNQVTKYQVTGNTTSGRALRDAAARAMQGWHSQRLLGNGEVGDPIIKDKNSSSTSKREKQLKSIGFLKRKKPSVVDRVDKAARMKVTKPQLDTMVVDIGPPADWVKVNVQKTKDCFEVYALVPGLLREEVRVQSDPAGRLVISGQPEQLDNPWGVTPFKKVVSLPSRIDPHQTSAVVTLHGQLFVRVPFEPSDL